MCVSLCVCVFMGTLGIGLKGHDPLVLVSQGWSSFLPLPKWLVPFISWSNLGNQEVVAGG